MIILTVITTEEAHQADVQNSPVSSGINLEVIDISKPDRLVTHLLPVSHIDMVTTLQHMATQNKGVEATVAGSADTGMTLILTGPAKGVQDAAASIVKADKPDSSKTVTKTIQLRGANAESIAASLNSTFASQNAPAKAVADRRTNSHHHWSGRQSPRRPRRRRRHGSRRPRKSPSHPRSTRRLPTRHRAPAKP